MQLLQLHVAVATLKVQWSLHVMTVASAIKFWSKIGGGLKIEGYLY